MAARSARQISRAATSVLLQAWIGFPSVLFAWLGMVIACRRWSGLPLLASLALSIAVAGYGWRLVCHWGERQHDLAGACLLRAVGGRGPGKTQLAVCAMHRACLAGQSTRYVKALDFFAEVKAAYSSYVKEEERDVIKRFCSPTLLVIDGMEERGETSWEARMLSHLIDRRYDDLKDTILIANLKAEEFKKSIGTSAASRLHETGGIVPCEWASFRE